MIRRLLLHRRTISTTFVDKTAVLIGNVKLGQHVSIFPTAVLRGDVNTITVGDYSNVQDGVVVHCGAKAATNIGSLVSIGHGARLHGCEVADRVLIGISATVLDGSAIGEDTLIGAGALVPPGKKLAPGGLWVGSPAKRVRDLTPAEIRAIRENAEIYIELGARYCKGDFGGRC